MSIIAITLLAVLALAQPILRGWGRHALLGAGLQTVLLALAAGLAAAADPVTGFWRSATLVLAVGAAALSADPVVRASFALARRSTRLTDSPAREEDDSDGQPGPLRGGLAIGILERAAIAAAVLTHWPEGIAIVLAVKGLARYPELRRPDASEQFIIGTFASVLWALAVCGVATLLIT